MAAPRLGGDADNELANLVRLGFKLCDIECFGHDGSSAAIHESGEWRLYANGGENR
jgi:hypothetical protein